MKFDSGQEQFRFRLSQSTSSSFICPQGFTRAYDLVTMEAREEKFPCRLSLSGLFKRESWSRLYLRVFIAFCFFSNYNM